jgi:hypothetical protein
MTMSLENVQDAPASVHTAAEPISPATEAAELEALMLSNIDAYHGPYKDTGISGAERLLALRRAEAEAASADSVDDADLTEDETSDTADGEKDATKEAAEPASEEDEAEESRHRIDGAPAKAPDYRLPDDVEGFSWDEGEKAGVMPYLEVLHETGATQKQVAAALRIYAEQRVAAEEQLQSRDSQDIQAAREALGADYATTINNVKAILPTGELRERILAARSGDGQRLTNDPAFIEWIAALAGGRTATQTPPSDNLASEESALNELMHSDIDKFMNARWRGSEQTGSERLLAVKRARTAAKR